MDRTRCFVAVPLESPASEAVGKLLRNLRQEVPGVRWVKLENLHLTIKFLGDLDNRDLPEACRLLRAACQEVEPFPIRLQGLGTFPGSGAPRVVWLGVSGDTESLESIHQRLDRSLEALGVRREGRAFRPHLTLGRPTSSVDARSLEAAFEAMGDALLAESEVDQLRLMASFLGRAGPTYEAIDSVLLG